MKNDIKKLNMKPISYFHMKNKFDEFLSYLQEEVDNYNLQKNM